MKHVFFTLIIISGILGACDTPKKATDKMVKTDALNGTWELNFISGPRIAFDGLYPEKKPSITFDVANARVSGNTGCNNFNGTLNATGSSISFNEPLAMTKMFCDGIGESTFTDILKKVDNWTVDGKTLNLRMGEVNMMRFTRKS